LIMMHIGLLVQEVKDYAFFLLDTKGRIQSWNTGAQRVKGLHAKRNHWQHFSIFYTRDDLANKKPQRELEKALTERAS